MKYLGLTVIALACIGSSCKKKTDCVCPSASTPIVTLDEAEKVIAILTSHPWKYVESYYRGNNQFRPCDADDVDTYTTSGDHKTDIGIKTCSDDQKNTLSAWKLMGTDKIVYIAANYRDTVNIIYISDSQLITGVEKSGIKSTDKYIK